MKSAGRKEILKLRLWCCQSLKQKQNKIIKRPFLKEKLLQKKNTGSLVQHYTSLKSLDKIDASSKWTGKLILYNAV